VNRVNNYIKKFENAKLKVMQISVSFTVGFVSGLKDDIKRMVNMFQPTIFKKNGSLFL
jgi:hypothetical protein